MKPIKNDPRFKEIMERLKKKVEQNRLAAERNKQFTAPRYDQVYFEGLAYLDAIARGEIDG